MKWQDSANAFFGAETLAKTKSDPATKMNVRLVFSIAVS